MKKLFLLICLLATVTVAQAEVIKLQATSYAYKYQNDYGYWTDWTDWEYTSVLIVVNTDNNRINIYSNTPQEYDIYDYGRTQYDDDGGETTTLKCIDADGLRCEVRIRVERNGNRQLYIDYNDAMWVYNIVNK